VPDACPYSEEVVDPALLALCAASLRAYPASSTNCAHAPASSALTARGTLHVAFDEATADARVAQCEAFRRNGADAVVLDRDATLAREPMLGGSVRGAVYVANESHVDNRRLGRALVAAAPMRACASSAPRRYARSRCASRARHPHRARLPGCGYRRQRSRCVGRGLAGVPEPARVAVRPVAGEMLALAVRRVHAGSCGRSTCTSYRATTAGCSSVRPASNATSTSG